MKTGILILSFRVLPAAFLLAGCYSMDIASNAALDGTLAKKGDTAAAQVSKENDRASKHVEHVVVSNYGWYLFNYIPLACGNATPEAWFPWAFFSDRVSSRLLHDRMMSYAASKKANVKELAFFRDEQVFFNIPGTKFTIPIPYLLCFREIQFSGVLMPRLEEVGQ